MDSFENFLPRLLKIPLFSAFDVSQPEDKEILKKLYESFSTKNFKKGKIIINEGEEGDIFYILHSGKVHIFRNTLSGDQISLAHLSSEQNISFGETALIGLDTRTASIMAESDCSTINLSGNDFHKLCEKYPVLGYKVLRQLSTKLLKTVNELNKDKAALYETLFDEIGNID